jgi:hypothetical protein
LFRERNGLMMSKESEQFTLEDFRYLKVAISLALTGPDIQEMPKTQVALNELYDKIERMQGNKDQLFRGDLISWG